MRTIVFLALLLSASTATAQQHQAPGTSNTHTRAQRRLVGLVAKVSFNEALDSYHDLALIWQVVEGVSESPRRRFEWLSRHSSCVSGRLPDSAAYARDGNCRWSRNLGPDGEQPRGWIPAEDGRWILVRDRWLEHIARARDFVYGVDSYRPCAETPDTWDGVRYGREFVSRGNREILECSVPYLQPREEGDGLRNFAVRRRSRVALR